MGNVFNQKRPCKCDHCGYPSPVLELNSVIYNGGRTYGEWPLVWYCPHCRSSVGCHNGTDIPYGFMAPSAVRKARCHAHKAFDPIWEDKHLTRTEAYSTLASYLKISLDECHISLFGIEQCQAVVEASKSIIKSFTKKSKTNHYQIKRRN